MNSGSKKPYIELVTGSVLFGLLGVFVERLQDVPTGPLIFYKQIFGVLSLLIFMVLTGKLSQIEAQKGSILALLEPVSGIFFDVTILHTILLIGTLTGCIFILPGAYIAVMEKSPKIFGKYFRIQV